LFFGLSRQAATEFSFFLAVPTLIGAAAFELYSDWHLLAASVAGSLAIGSVTAFASALLCIRWLLRFVATHDFTAFAWYGIAAGLIVLAVILR
jgi:undecaprenyl-diphosphatase